MAQLIPRVSSQMLRESPDQVAMILNELIDEINELRRNK